MATSLFPMASLYHEIWKLGGGEIDVIMPHFRIGLAAGGGFANPVGHHIKITNTGN